MRHARADARIIQTVDEIFYMEFKFLIAYLTDGKTQGASAIHFRQFNFCQTSRENFIYNFLCVHFDN